MPGKKLQPSACHLCKPSQDLSSKLLSAHNKISVYPHQTQFHLFLKITHHILNLYPSQRYEQKQPTDSFFIPLASCEI